MILSGFREMSKYPSIIQCYQVKFQWFNELHRGNREREWVDCDLSLGQIECVA